MLSDIQNGKVQFDEDDESQNIEIIDNALQNTTSTIGSEGLRGIVDIKQLKMANNFLTLGFDKLEPEVDSAR